MVRAMTRALLLAVLFCGCASVSSTLREAHTGSLQAQAGQDFSCPREQVQTSSTDDEHWTATGCGKTKSYVLKNPNCLVERDCVWAPQ